jgi:hypothetical protein
MQGVLDGSMVHPSTWRPSTASYLLCCHTSFFHEHSQQAHAGGRHNVQGDLPRITLSFHDGLQQAVVLDNAT